MPYCILQNNPGQQPINNDIQQVPRPQAQELPVRILVPNNALDLPKLDYEDEDESESASAHKSSGENE